jgi:hypothetical protein
VSLGVFIIVLTVAAAVLALWAVVRFPRVGPDTLTGALVQIGVAFVAGFVLVPVGMRSALSWHATAGPIAAIFVFALPGLLYLFLASIWAMRVLQEMMSHARR